MTAVPAHAPKPQDHLKPAAQRESEGDETATVQWRDFTFEVAATPDDWPVDVVLAFEEGKAVTGIRALLGPKQWAELQRTKPKARDIGDLFAEVAKVLGFEDPGN